MTTSTASHTTTPRPYDAACMRAAIALSQTAVDAGCMPFGAVAADADGNIIATAHNKSKAAKKRGGTGDVTRHAEMELVRTLSSSTTNNNNITIYTSTEPCVMCGGAIYWSSGVNRVVYGCSALELETKLSGPGGFDIPIEQLYSMGRTGTRKIEIVGPLLSDEAMKVHAESGIWKGCQTATTDSTATTDTKDTTDMDTDTTPIAATDKDIETERSLFQSGLGAAASANVGDVQVPIISLKSSSSENNNDNDNNIAEQLWQAATTVGFFTVIDHGIPQELIDSAFASSARFFQDNTQTEKEAQSPFAKHLNAGYEYFSQIRPSTPGMADQKESLQITARETVMDGRWPSNPIEFQTISHELLQHAHALAGRILDLLEPRACPDNVPGSLRDSHTLWGDDGQCTLRYLHYPPMSPELAKELTTPTTTTTEDGADDGRPRGVHWRAGPHTDWCNVTLLFQREGEAGLECCANPHSASASSNNGSTPMTTTMTTWTPVDPVPGGIAINIGDMLARWSDQRLYSNLHRVRMPNTTVEECEKSRYSIAFFAQSDKATMIRSKDSPPMTAGDYILSRVKSNF